MRLPELSAGGLPFPGVGQLSFLGGPSVDVPSAPVVPPQQPESSPSSSMSEPTAQPSTSGAPTPDQSTVTESTRSKVQDLLKCIKGVFPPLQNL